MSLRLFFMTCTKYAQGESLNDVGTESGAGGQYKGSEYAKVFTEA